MFRNYLAVGFVIIFLLGIIGAFIPEAESVYLGNDPTLKYNFKISLVASEMMQRLGNKKFIDPALDEVAAPTQVFLLMDGDVDIEELLAIVSNLRLFPEIEGFKMGLAIVSPENIDALKELPGVRLILKDTYIDFPGELDNVLYDVREKVIKGEISVRDAIRTLVEAKKNWINSNGGDKKKGILDLLDASVDGANGVIEPKMFWATDLVGARGWWSQYNGSGVTIAVVDTGVDYGAVSLFSWKGKVARDIYGKPAAFDADNQVLVFTNYTVTAYASGGSVFINTAGLDPMVWLGTFFPFALPFSALNGSPFSVDMNVTGILNPGDTAQFGVMFEWIFGLDLIPVLVVDRTGDSIYDTVYVDLSSDYCEMFSYLCSPDWSFADEEPLTLTGDTVPTFDFDGDGLPDHSAGSLAYGIDLWSVAPADTGTILEPIDDTGQYVNFVYDWHYHGTAVSGVAAGLTDLEGKKICGYFYYPCVPYSAGVAPNASIMGIPIFTIGSMFEAWFWAAGFDLIPGTEGWYPIPGFGTAYGLWNYTGKHKADIISNSWGWVDWEHATLGWFIYGPFIMTLLADALSLPGYLNDTYPGTLFVISAGNEGPGAGTTGPPGYSGFAITAGASTSLSWLPVYGWSGGYNDTVVYFSSRGPNVVGYPTPDLVAPGAFGWVPHSLWVGFGNGNWTMYLFGGTSMAAPFISGSAAVVIHAYREIYGSTPTPDEVKRILMESAEDLHLPPNVQGAGRVDIDNAINMLLNGVVEPVISFKSPQTSINYVSREFIPFFFNWLLNPYFNDPFTALSAAANWNELSVYDWFRTGETASSYPITYVENYGLTSQSYNVYVYKYQMVNIEVYNLSITSYKGPYYWSRSEHLVLAQAPITPDWDFMRIKVIFDYGEFDVDHDHLDDLNLYLLVYDWNDITMDDYIDSFEVSWIGYSPLWGTTQEVLVTREQAAAVQWNLTINVVEWWNWFGPFVPRFKVVVEYWKKVPHPWITPSTPTITVPAGGVQPISVDINVPTNEVPTVHQGFIVLEPTSYAGKNITIPFSIMVSKPLSAYLGGPIAWYMPSTSYGENYYDPNWIDGYFDWGTADSGDHRIWFFEYLGDPEQRTFGIYAFAKWSNPYTDIDMFSIDSGLFVNDKSEDTWDGYSAYHVTRPAPSDYILIPEEFVAVWPWPSMYWAGPDTISLWSRLYGGNVPSERVVNGIAFAKLSFGNGTLFNNTNVNATRVGSGVILHIPVFIETGVNLTAVQFFGFETQAGMSLDVTPNPAPAVEFSPNNKVYMNLFVPNSVLEDVFNTGPQKFYFNVSVTADYLPYSTKFLFQILIEPFPLPLKTFAETRRGIIFLNIGRYTGEVLIYPYYRYLPDQGSFGSAVNKVIKYPVIVKNVFVSKDWGMVEVLVKITYHDGTSAWLPGQIWVFRNQEKVYVTGVFHTLPAG